MGAALLAVLCGGAAAQQPNAPSSALFVQFRDGAPWPLVADAPNNGVLNTFVRGTPNVPWALFLGPLHPSALVSAGGQRLDVGTPPAFTDVVSVGAGGGDPSVTGWLSVMPSGIASVNWPIGTGLLGTLPGIQGVLLDPTSPEGFRMTGASRITLKPAKSIVFVQGDYNPGPIPNCRLADVSPYGFSTLRDTLSAAGFSSVTEVIDTTTTLNAAFTAGKGVIVLGSNQRTLSSTEITTLHNFVRTGNGVVVYADAQFGPNNWNSDNGFLVPFGLAVAPDNFGGNTAFGSFATHPVTRGLTTGITAEGISLIQTGTPTLAYALSPIALAPCASNPGCAPTPASPPMPSANPAYTAIAVASSTGGGRVAVTCDRNTFLNPPGIGTSLEAADNLLYAINLFYWAAGY